LKKLARGIKNSHNFIVTIPVPVRTPDGKGFLKQVTDWFIQGTGCSSSHHE